MRMYKYIISQDKNVICNCSLGWPLCYFLYHMKLICKTFGDFSMFLNEVSGRGNKWH